MKLIERKKGFREYGANEISEYIEKKTEERKKADKQAKWVFYLIISYLNIQSEDIDPDE